MIFSIIYAYMYMYIYIYIFLNIIYKFYEIKINLDDTISINHVFLKFFFKIIYFSPNIHNLLKYLQHHIILHIKSNHTIDIDMASILSSKFYTRDISPASLLNFVHIRKQLLNFKT